MSNFDKKIPPPSLSLIGTTNQINPIWWRYLRDLASQVLYFPDTTGYVVFTGNTSVASREITAASAKIVITNGDGVDGNTTLDVDESHMDLSLIGGVLTVEHGGTGATTAADARASLEINAFSTIAVSGQDDLISNDMDTLTLANGSHINITTNSITNTATIGIDFTPYANSDAIDAVGNILVDSSTIDFTYNSGIPSITADIIDSSITTAKLGDDQVTYAKIQNISATDKILGRSTAGAGDVEEIICTAAGRAILDDTTAADQRTTLGAAASGANSDITSLSGLTGTIKAPTGIYSSSGEVLMDFVYSPSAVNFTQWANAPSGTAPYVVSSGTDASVGFSFLTKNGAVNFLDITGTSAIPLRFLNAAGNSFFGIKAAATGPNIDFTLPTADGTANQALITNGSGALSFGNPTVTGVTVSQGGTGASSFTTYAVLCGGTTGTGAIQSIAGVGTSGQVLTSNGAGALPTFQNASGGSGSWDLISTATASSSSSIDFTSLSSTYFMYVVVLANVTPATDNVALYFRTSTDNGSSYDSGASDYRWAYNVSYDNATGGVIAGAGSTHIELCRSIGNASDIFVNGCVYIYNPSAAVKCQISWDIAHKYYTGGIMAFSSGAGNREATADVDAIRFIMSSGNISSGIFKLYGAKAS